MSFGMRVLVIVMSAAIVLGGALAVRWMGSTGGKTVTAVEALQGLKVNLMRCEVSAIRTEAVIKVHLQLRNDGTLPLRFGPGSFWLVDVEGFPYLDVHAAEKPDEAPLKLAPSQTGPEMELKFFLPPSQLARSLLLLVGEAPAGKVAGSPPPKQGIRVMIKENGAPKGPFVDGDWKTYVGTRWR